MVDAPEGRDRYTVGGSQLRSRADAFTPDGLLACSDEHDLALAMEHLDALLRAATILLGAAGHRSELPCDHADCLLDDVADGPALCALARDLVGDRPTPSASSAGLPLAVAQFRAALPNAMDAVRACRQRAHPSGTCWFATEPGRDTCGAVLRTAHQVC